MFHFAEIPLCLAGIYLGLQWLPGWVVRPYEGLLLAISPIVTILEGLASMVIITSAGQGLSDFLHDRSAAWQAFFGAVCVGLYSVSSMVIFSLYYSGQVSTLATASLVAVVLTLVGVLSAGTVMLEHGVITDAALLFLYVTYNIWTLTSGKAAPLPMQTRNLLGYLNGLSWTAAPSQDSLLGIVGSLLAMFSVELLTGLFIQMSVFLMAGRLIDTSGDPDEVKAARASTLRRWLFGAVWPCFGKAILILVYTYAWLAHGLSTPVAWYIDPGMWRWINIFFCLTVYMKHLLAPVDRDEYASVWPHED